ncbi:hypothetical protein D3C85_1681120 [compost metagenome]
MMMICNSLADSMAEGLSHNALASNSLEGVYKSMAGPIEQTAMKKQDKICLSMTS